MAQAIANSVIDSLRQLPLLDAAQKEELSRLEAAFAKPRELLQELVRRGWLTFYQGNQLLQGKGQDLVLSQYVLLEKIGEGGMGQVYRAKQRNLDRVVALKVIRKECLDNPKVISRFQREIRAAGHLSHPNIVRAYDADQVGNTYYIAMEYIDGVDLARMVKDNGPLPVEQACDLIQQAALGLQHAHERGLVHRDIKPANLLVSKSQESAARSQGSGVRRVGSGVRKLALGGKVPSGARDVSGVRKAITEGTAAPAADARAAAPDARSLFSVLKILDLGLARWEDPATGHANTHLTQMGSVMGTPDFISPEQARNSHTCDIRADLYSLGCTLYYMLAGRIPFLGGSFAEKLIKHQMDEPDPIAVVRHAMLVNFHARRGTTKIPCKLLAVPDDVAAIVAKLMAKKPEDRFQTPDELAQALEQALDRLANAPQAKPSDATECETITPVAVAHEPTLVEPLVKVASVHGLPRTGWTKRPWTRRRWLTLGGVAALVLFALVLAGLGGGNAKPQASDVPPKQVAGDQAWQALQLDVQQKTLAPADLRAKLLDFKRQHPARARDVAALLQQVASPFDVFDRAVVDKKQWYAWMPDELVAVLGMWRGFAGNKSTHSVAVSPDGRWIVAGEGDRSIRIWDTGASPIPWSVVNPTWGRITRVAIAPDGNLLATACEDGAARLYDVKNRKLLHTLDKHPRAVTCVAFHPESALIATAGNDGVVRLWNTSTGASQAEIQTSASKVAALCFTPDGNHVFWGGDNQEVHWANLAGHSPNHWRHPVESGPVKTLAFHPDNQAFVCGGSDGSLHLCSWDGQKVKDKAVLHKHDKTVNGAAFAPDGQCLATVGDDAQVILWDTSTGNVKKSWELRFPIHSLAWAPDSRHLLIANANGTVYIFRLGEAAALAQAK